MKKYITSFILTATFLSGATNAFAALPAGFEVETVASGFYLPTTIAFAPDGRIFVAEKTGTVRVVKNGAVLPTPLITLTDVNSYGDKGLIGMAIDPNFATNGYVYLSYTYENTPGTNLAGPKTGRIVRITVVGDTADESTKVILVGKVGGTLAAPSCENYNVTEDCIPSDTSSHSVGGLRFGPDGKLYATLGDGSHFDYIDPRALRSQNIDSLGGKLLRINTDGTAPSDNPYYNGSSTSNRSKVYAYGMRNSFRFNFHPTTNVLYTGDVGWGSWEELNKITPGANYGWPCREGNTVTAYNCTPTATPIAPLYTYPHDSNGAGAVVGGAFGTAYPAAYANTLFFGDYAQNYIKTATLSATGSLISINDFMLGDDGSDGPVEMLRGPDGNVYFLSIYTGNLRRILYTTGNRQPIARASATPTSGSLPLAVSFSSSASSDPDGNPLTYLWNFGNGATSTAANPTYTFTVRGTYNASLTVFDGQGGSSVSPITIVAGNRAPTATITSPASASLYRIGDSITATANATDPEDGSLPASAYNWSVILHHNTHIHILQTATGPSFTFTAPDHSGATDIYTELKLTVTDSAGLTDTRSVSIYLNNNPTTSGNLILNPSLEDPAPGATTSPDKWAIAGYGTNAANYIYPVPGFDGEDGARVQVISYSGGDAKWGFEPVSVDANQKYLYSSYYKATVPSRLLLQIGNVGSTFSYFDLGEVPASASWTRIERMFTAPINSRTAVIFQSLEQVGTLDIDNFSLTRDSSATTTPPTDTTAPSVAITSPTSGTTLTGTATISATSSDNVGVAGVKFYQGTTLLGTEDTTAPYTATWNTASSTNGSYTLLAVSRDTAGNVATSSPVSVTVANTTGGTGTTTPPTSTSTVNLIVNPSVEVVSTTTANTPFAWTKDQWGTNTTTFTYPVTGGDGANAVRVSMTAYTSGDAKWQPNDVSVTPGKAYTFSELYQSNATTSVILRYTSTTNVLSYVNLNATLPPSATFKTVSYSFTVPANIKSATILHVLARVGTLTTDAYSLVDPTQVSTTTPPTDTTAPSVAITSPTSGTTLTGTATISATSSDNVGVAGVKFYQGTTLLGTEDTTAPYTATWNTASSTNGSYTLLAVSRDTAGNVATSSPVSVTVANTTGGTGTTTPPTASSTNLIVNGNLETASSTGDPTGWFRAGWGNSTKNYVYPVTSYNGTKAIRVEVTNYVDGDVKWAPNDVPMVYGTLYTFSDRYKGTTISDVIGRYTLNDNSYVYFGVIKELQPSTNWNTAVATFTPPLGVKSVTFFHIISYNGTLDIDDMSLTASGSATSTNDLTAPVAQIITPAANQVVSGNVLLTASSSDNIGVSYVWFAVDGTQVSPFLTTTPYTHTWDSRTIANGSHVLKVTTNDAAGNNSTATTTIIVNNSSSTPPTDTTAPSIAITSPTGTSTLTGIVTASASSSDNTGVVGVKFYLDNILLGSEDTIAPYTASFSTASTTNGSHWLYAVARDAAGNVASSTMINISTYALQTTLKISAFGSAGTSTGKVLVTASSSDGSQKVVTLSVDGTQLGSFPTSNGNTGYQFLSNEFNNGTHIITGTIYGQFNLTTSDSVSMVFSNSPSSGDVIKPTITVTSPTSVSSNDSYIITGPLNITASSSDNVGVAGVKFYYGSTGGNGAQLIGTEDTVAPYTASFNPTSSQNGYNAIFAVARDTSGNSATSTPLLVKINVLTDTVLPIVTITAPSSSSTVSGNVLISASSSDNLGIAKVQFLRTNISGAPTVLGESISAPYQFMWDTSTTPNGVYRIIAESTDISGNNGFADISVIINNTTTPPPTGTTNPNDLISNGSFENRTADGTVKDWSQGGFGNNNPVFSVSATSSDEASFAQIKITSYVDGDAKWVFKDVLVAPGIAYDYSMYYKSDVATPVTVRYTMTNGSFVYVDLPLASSTPIWTEYKAIIVPPADAASVTVFHRLTSIGTLQVDSYSLSIRPSDPLVGAFSQGMVSFTLDDGWLSQYTNALPILNAANIKASFGVISQETIQAAKVNRVDNPSLEITSSPTTPTDWTFSAYGTNNAVATFPVAGYEGTNAAKIDMTSYTDGDAKWYFKDTDVLAGESYRYTSYYTSDATTRMLIRYTMKDGSIQYVPLDTLPAQSAWTLYDRIINISANVKSVTMYHIIESVGSLTIDNVSLVRLEEESKITPSMVLAIQAAGHEISSHTRTHASLSTVATSTMVDEVVNSKSDLIGIGASPVKTLIYPYGDYSDSVIQELKNDGYVAARSVDRGYNLKSTDKYALKIQQIDLTTTPSEINAWVDKALADKTWLILMYHQIDGNGAELSQTPANFQSTVNYVVSRAITPVTLLQGINQMNP